MTRALCGLERVFNKSGLLLIVKPNVCRNSANKVTKHNIYDVHFYCVHKLYIFPNSSTVDSTSHKQFVYAYYIEYIYLETTCIIFLLLTKTPPKIVQVILCCAKLGAA